MSKRVIIIGGGITGLSAAFYVQEMIRELQLPYKFRLIESGHRLGGKIATVYQDGFVIERGPDSFLARKKAAITLLECLSLTDQLVSNATGQAYILSKNKLHVIPEG